MGKKNYNPRFMFGGTGWCNTDMACKILCEAKFPEKTSDQSIQSVSLILRKAMERGEIKVERERGIIAWNVPSVHEFVNAYEPTKAEASVKDDPDYKTFCLALTSVIKEYESNMANDILAKIEEIIIPKIVQEVRKIFV